MKITKRILTGAIAASLMMGTQAYAFGPNGGMAPEGAQNSPDVRVEAEEKFGQITGKVISVTKLENNTGVVSMDDEGNVVENPHLNTWHILVEREDSGMVNFVVNSSTIFARDLEAKEGDIVTGIYNLNLPAIMIYPPQYHAVVMAVGLDNGESVFYGTFDENLVSADNTLKLNIGEKTEVVLEDGNAFFEKGESLKERAEALKNMELAVIYTASTRSIPAQTTPSKVLVPYSNIIMPLGETGMAAILPETVEVDEADETLTFDNDLSTLDLGDISQYGIMVGGSSVEGAAYWHNNAEGGVIMVPLRAVAEALGYEVEWNNDERSVLIGGEVSVRIGDNSYGLGTAPEIVNDRTYVPIELFEAAALANEVITADGKIVINMHE